MNSFEKNQMTRIESIDGFSPVIEKLTTGEVLAESEKVYILSCAIVFGQIYQEDKRRSGFIEFAYYIILKYGVQYNDYIPLFYFASNFGFFPIVRFISKNNLLGEISIDNFLIDKNINQYTNLDYIETYEQNRMRKLLLEDTSTDVAYVAPTSYGKSSCIIDVIKKEQESKKKIAIIVPTKSLLMQTYKMVSEVNFQRKIIIHDEMYQGEDKFICIFTQERALRLLSKNNTCFDLLFIDEAHNLLDKSHRSVLIARLLKKSKALNPCLKVVYLSPLLTEAKGLSISSEQAISEYRINFPIKD